MDILEAFHRRKLRKKQKKSAMFHSEVALNRAPSLASVGATATGGDATATGLITRVLHLTRRRVSRPHSWHFTKLGEGSSESVEHVDRMSSVHASATELLSDLDSGGGVRWSLESLEPAHTSSPPGSAHVGPCSSSSCLQLSSTGFLHTYHVISLLLSEHKHLRIALLHSKRESTFLSSSTSLSFPEGLGLGSERSFSLESVQQTADLGSVHCRPYGLALDHNTRGRVKLREPAGGVCYHGTSENRLLNRHSLGPIWSTGQSSCESLKGAPAPQRRSEPSQERPSSWSSLEPARSLRSLRCQQKSSWSHSSCSAPSAGSYITEGQLHPVIEKSPESSPSSKPRQAQSPGPLQEAPFPPTYSSGPNLGLKPTALNRNGYFSYHKAAEAERSFKDLHHHLDMFSSVACIGSRPCPSAVNSQGPAPDPHPALSPAHAQSSQQLFSDQEHPLTRLEKALTGVQSGENTCLSVLEKVSRFEHREWATRQLGSRHRSDRSGPKQVGDQGSSHGAEDVPKLPERSTSSSSTNACRTLSHGGGPQEKNRSYQDLRDPPTSVFRSTSFRCTKLPCGPTASLAPPPVPQKVHSYLDKRDTKHLPTREKTRPKTLPKPHGAESTLRSSARMASPLTVHLPGPPPGPPPLTRICGRKRLTWDQRKRSFSEPERMNEVGLTHTDSAALIRRAGDTSVADRRRMFEQAAHAPGQDSLLGPERNCQRKEWSQRRPQSAVFQLLHSAADSKSLTSSSGLLSLQDCTPEQHLLSGKGPLGFPLAPGADLHTSRCTVFYPGRVTAPLAPALQRPKSTSDSRDGALGDDIQSLQKTPSKDSLERTNGSLSSPPGDAVEQAGVTSERESSALYRAASGVSGGCGSPLLAHSPTSDLLLVSVPRRERPRRSDCSTLAASVGLPCPLSETIRPGHKSPPSAGQDISVPAKRTPTETGVDNKSASSDQRSAIGGYELKHQSSKENRPIEREDRVSTVCRADCENGTTPSPAPCPPASSPDQAQEDSLVLDYEPVPVRLQIPEEQRVHELVQSLVQCDRALLPLMDMWGKSTVDVLLEIFPNSQLFGKLSQKLRDRSLQDDWSPGPADVSSEPSVEQKHGLISMKVELCEALRTCIESLQQEKAVLSDELKAHTELGKRVDAWVQERCEDAHTDKYRLFIGDLERVVNLLLSLCGRLARVERSLDSLCRQEPTEGSTELWDSLVHKRSVLLHQTQDALELREHLEQRQCTVHTFLHCSLEPLQLQHYRRLVSSMPALLIAHRRLDELIQQSQEQLSLLLDTVPLEVTLARGWNRVGLALSTPFRLSHSQAPPTWHARVVPRPTHLDCPVTVTSL